MKNQFFYLFSINYAFLMIAACLLMTISCNDTQGKYGVPFEKVVSKLPVEYCMEGNRLCPFDVIEQWDLVPEKIRAESKTELLKYMDEEEMNRDIEFVEYRINEQCDELVKRGYIFNPFEMHFIRHFNNGIISKICFEMYFYQDQVLRATSILPNVERNPDYRNYISKTEFDSILAANNFGNYKSISRRLNGIFTHLSVHKVKDSIKPSDRYNESIATINLHTGEFNSSEEWYKATALNVNLLPKFGNIEKSASQLEEDRVLIDSLLRNGKTRRIASEELIKKAAKHLKNSKPKKAMPLFNQAYLLDSTNANVYWGFGRLAYKNRNQDAKKWYDIGLALDSNNVNLIRAYGRYEMGKYDSYSGKRGGQIYFNSKDSLWQVNMAQEKIQLAEAYFIKALTLHPGDLETMANLAELYLEKVDCENAIAFYEKSKTLKTNCSAQCFESQLIRKCGPIL